MSGTTAQPPRIFDRALVLARYARHAGGGADFITQLVLDDLEQRLAPITRDFSKALIMGPDATILPAKGRAANGTFTFTRAATLIDATVDPENLRLPDTGYDLIVSILDLQFVNDVPGFLSRIRAHLAPDGLMLTAAIGGDSLQELRSAWLTADAEISGGASPRIAPFIDVRNAGSLLQRTGFALPVADLEQHVVRYASPLALMQELHALSASNPLVDRPRKMTTRTALAMAAAAYADAASDPDGRIRATLEILWMSGWAPHENQQKPLAPGSAKVSLAKVLGNKDETGR
ncbi:methyltransferase domain-containing protein [Mariluticola halotolerans]|uniref:methyltransferase domain-containing protein n=1 Tax=Mariluticola halotolerans TaxID=2909283 RepID=UPI0026E38072|nr:methyltransferase domain-containing protein [Mariluticola halotolerans]UJQ93848.1 class I SAM-dependent methyltransferase [Mariluticola halotolerans]